MDEDLLVCVYSEHSHRHAILADDGVTGILYLHAPSEDVTKTGEVEATCFAYNRVDPIDINEVWLRCWVEGGRWHAATDERQLARVLGLFLDWAGESREAFFE